MTRALLILPLTALVAGCGNADNGFDAGVDLGVDLSLPMANQLASAQTLTHCLAVDGNNVYWADQASGNRVMKVAKTGGAASVVASGGSARTCVIVDAANAYFTDDGNPDAGTAGDVLKAPLGGGNATSIAADHVKSRLATDGTYLYWITDQYGPMDMMFSGKDALVRMPVGGGTIDVLYNDLSTPEAEELFVDTANVYYSDGAAVTARAKAGGGAPTKFGMGTLHGTPFVTDGTRLVIVEATGVGQGSLVLFHVDGTGRTVLTTTSATPLAVDDSGVYANQSGHLIRFSLDGKSTTQLTALGPRALALDATSIYFTDGAAILKLPK